MKMLYLNPSKNEDLLRVNLNSCRESDIKILFRLYILIPFSPYQSKILAK